MTNVVTSEDSFFLLWKTGGGGGVVVAAEEPEENTDGYPFLPLLVASSLMPFDANNRRLLHSDEFLSLTAW